jgi:anti-anti-sigma factor
MKVEIKEFNDKVAVSLAGEMDTAAAMEMEENLKSLCDTKGKEIVFDCRDLEYIASSGLRILLSILKSAKANGGNVVLQHVNEDIKDVFQLTGFINIFTIE